MMRAMQIVVTLLTLSSAAEQSSCRDTASDANHPAALLQVRSKRAPLILASGISSEEANLKVSSNQQDQKQLNVLQKMRPQAKQSKLQNWLSMVSSETGSLTCIAKTLK